MKLKVLDLFSGLGGFSLGLERTQGFETIAFCEINEFCRRVLHKHWPGVPVASDVTKMNFYEGMADVVVGGFPCQDVSCAGKRAGLAGERSGLYRELVRALRMVRPRYAIVENVAALLGDGMGTVLGDMAESGFDLEWDCVPAKCVGAPHERDRVYIVAHANSERCREAGQFRHRSFEMSSGGVAPARGKPSGDASDSQSGQGRTRRPADSFAWIRERARRHSADPYGSRLSFRAGLGGDAREEFTPFERGHGEDGRQSLWPDEPALSGVDDGIPDWMERVAATGNSIIPEIPRLIGKAILSTLEGGQ